MSRNTAHPPSPLASALSNPEAAPLARLLDDGFREEQVPRLFRGIEQRTRADSQSHWQLVAAAAVFLLAFGYWTLTGERALTLADGAVVPDLSGEALPRQVSLADGSSLKLAEASRLAVLRNDGSSFVTALRQGSCTFEVKPGGPRRWVVETGVASVEVVGTRFKVERHADGVTVSVQRGKVLVRSESLPEGKRFLSAGDSWRSPATTKTTDTAGVEPPEREAADAAELQPEQEGDPSPDAGPHESAESASQTADAPRAVTKDVRSSPGALPPQRTSSTNQLDQVSELTQAADAARRRGQPELAMQNLEQALRVAKPNDPRRAALAMTLARLSMESNPEKAAQALEGDLHQMPGSLAEDALARLVEARARAGNRAGAQDAAEEYLSRFPNGRRASEVRRWSKW